MEIPDGAMIGGWQKFCIMNHNASTLIAFNTLSKGDSNSSGGQQQLLEVPTTAT